MFHSYISPVVTILRRRRRRRRRGGGGGGGGGGCGGGGGGGGGGAGVIYRLDNKCLHFLSQILQYYFSVLYGAACPSVHPSVCQTRHLRQNKRKLCHFLMPT